MEGNKDEISVRLEAAAKGRKKACVFGTGFFSEIGCRMLEHMGITVDFFCDNDPEKWGKDIKGHIRCVSPSALGQMGDDTVCFLMIGRPGCYEVQKQLKKAGIKEVITVGDLLCLEESADYAVRDYHHLDYGRFGTETVKKRETTQGIKGQEKPLKSRIAVYTCISGGYDLPCEPEYISENCDYFLVSDKRPAGPTVYRFKDINEYIPKDLDNVRKNRYCKINAHELFPEYRYSIYLDGNAVIRKDISAYVEKTGSAGIAAHTDYYFNDIYIAGMLLSELRYERKDTVSEIMLRYWTEGMPKQFGQFECGMLVREHNLPDCRQIMKDWWNEVLHHSRRDQLSFTYALWKNGFTKESIGVLGNNFYDSDDFKIVGHKERRPRVDDK